MELKMLGVNSAFATGQYIEENGKYLYDPKWQSNFLLEFKNARLKDSKGVVILAKDILRFVLDVGGDARHSLKQFGLTPNDIDVTYISHPHSDHIGGLECIFLSTLFNPFYSKAKEKELSEYGYDIFKYMNKHNHLPDDCKPIIMGQFEVLNSGWEASIPGGDTLQGVRHVSLVTYFHVIPMDAKDFYIEEYDDNNNITRRWLFYTVESTHVIGGTKHMPSFGLFFKEVHNDLFKLYFPTDTMFMMPPTMVSFYNDANYIYQDTETGFRSGVHSHIDDIRKADPNIKKKLYLYHYNEPPVVDEDEFAGVLKRMDIHYY
jgi:ribonuclease BN (tRNA processing enzyme)